MFARLPKRPSPRRRHVTTLSEIGQEMDAERVHDMCRQWARERGLTTIPDPGVMHYIERLEAALAIAVPALRSIATPALGGKAQQYTAQHALKALEQHEREAVR